MKRMIFSLVVLAAMIVAAPAIAGEGDGQAVFEAQKCTMCHSVAAVDIEAKTTSEKMKGPDLSGYSTDMELAKVAAYLRGEETIDDVKHKKPYKGTDEELQTILDWLGSLEAQE